MTSPAAPLADLLARYDKAGGRYMVCPVCFNAKQLDKGGLLANAELAGSAADGSSPVISLGIPIRDWVGATEA